MSFAVESRSSGFRILNDEEVAAVAGGLDHPGFTVIGNRGDIWTVSINAEDIWMYPELFGQPPSTTTSIGGDAGPGGGGGGGLLDVLRDHVDDIISVVANLAGYEVIDADHQRALNADMNTKTIEQRGTMYTPDGDAWEFVITSDGERYIDRNGDKLVDVKTRSTPFGEQVDYGDGAGWRLPG